jgi:putative tail protein
MIPTGKTNPSLTKPHGIAGSGGAYDSVITYAGGLVQLPLKLAWYNGWGGHGSDVNPRLMAVTGGSAKKKSGKKSDTTYYSAAVDFILGLAPVRGVLSFWYNNQKFICTILGASGTIGTDPGGSGNGYFAWTPSGTDSKTTYSGTVPGSPYQVTVPNFVADMNRVKVNGIYLVAAEPGSSPGIGQYTVDNAGHYEFNVAQAGGTLSIEYRKLSSGGSALLAGVVAAVVHETYTASFDDFGGPGPVDVAGTWEQPLWNADYPVPGRIDAGAYRARDPYSYWQAIDGSAKLYFPAALIGKPVTVYYAVPQILKSDGSFYSDDITPSQLLNLELEPQFGEGAQYTQWPTQQIVNPFAAGMGCTDFDLGASNAVPNLLAETISAFTLFPNGDGDVVDFLTDLVKSGPTLIPAGSALGGASSFTSTNTGDSGLPNYGDGTTRPDVYGGALPMDETQGTVWIKHSNGLNVAGWTIAWSGFGSGTPSVAYFTYNVAAPLGLTQQQQLHLADGTHSVTINLSVGDNQSIDISGWNLATLTASFHVERSLPDDSYVEVTLQHPSVVTLSDPLTINPVGHGCNLNDYVGTPVPGQGEVLGDLTAMRSYCRAYGITVAPKLDGQRPAKDFFDELLLVANTAAVYSGKRINLIPRCEVGKAGNGAVYTPPGAVFELTDKDFVKDGKTPHIKFSRPRRSGCDNVYSVEYTDRAIDYGSNVVSGVDQRSVALYGPRKGGAVDTAILGQRPSTGAQSIKSISNGAVAQIVADQQAHRSAAGLDTITFELKIEHGDIEGMDIGTISSEILNIPPTPVRINSSRETAKRTWQCEAEPFRYGLNASRPKPTMQATGSLQTGRVAVDAAINDPIFFEPPGQMASGLLGTSKSEVDIIVSSSDPNYGGCRVYVSTDGGASYSAIGFIGKCTTGILTDDFPTHAAGVDSTNTLELDLSESLGTLVSQPELLASGGQSMACYVEGAGGTFEIVSPITATPGADYTVSCSSTVRGLNGTAPEAHGSGARFAVADGAFRYQVPAAYVGQTLYFKFVPSNRSGGLFASLADCTAYPYTPSGANAGSGGDFFLINGS